MYPLLTINLTRIKENAIIMLKKCKQHNIELVGVGKLVSGNKEIIQTYLNAGIEIIADSRIKNLKMLNDLEVKKMLLGIPMLSELEDVVRYSDICLVSESKTIAELNRQAQGLGKIYNIILMIETGDIREGLSDPSIINKTMELIINSPNIKLEGLGTNFAWYGTKIPSTDKLIELTQLKKTLEKKYNIKIPKISAGNSSHLAIWDDESIPKEVNQIRSGIAILMGIGFGGQPISYLNRNNFKLKCQIVEVQTKPTMPRGGKGVNAFGQEFATNDVGDRKKAIIALGLQDVDMANIFPVDKKIIKLSESTDYTILDITDCDQEYKVGDIIEFDLNYAGVLSCIRSKFVRKHSYEQNDI